VYPELRLVDLMEAGSPHAIARDAHERERVE
jgi:hypothetical protein